MIDDFLAVHANSLQLRGRRTQILASNIANADTPNYKARDLAFAEVLRDVNAGQPGSNRLSTANRGRLQITDSKHINTGSLSGPAQLMYRQPMEASLDGNTVDKDLEQARFAENNLRYEASLQFINSRVKGLIRSLRGE